MPKKTDEWTPEEQVVFKAFGVSESAVDLRRFIRGQRQINGRLYSAIELILDSFPPDKTRPTPSPEELLRARAEEANDGVPGDPPGCTGPYPG